MSTSPWIDRFDRLDDEKIIVRKTLLRPDVISGLATMPPDIGAGLIEFSLKQSFIPTDRTVSVLQTLVRRAMAYSIANFPTHDAHLRKVYAATDKKKRSEPWFATCLTGLAGVGKSQVLRALERLLPPPSGVPSIHGHPAFPMESCWYVEVGDRKGVNTILLPLSIGYAEKKAIEQGHRKPRVAAQGTSGEKILVNCMENAAISGISTILVDELQFHARSKDAIASTTSLLEAFCKIGPAVVYAANFDLCHKLMKTQQQIKQRYISSPIVLLPDDPNGKDWGKYLNECNRIMDGMLDSSILNNQKIIYGYTAGLKRVAAQLFIESFKVCRQRGGTIITLDDCENAYLSTEFSSNAADVAIIKQHILLGRCQKTDMWCPFEVPKDDIQRIRENFEVEANRNVARIVAVSALTKKERMMYDELKSNPKPIKEAASKRAPGRKPASKKDLMANYEEYQRKLQGDES